MKARTIGVIAAVVIYGVIIIGALALAALSGCTTTKFIIHETQHGDS